MISKTPTAENKPGQGRQFGLTLRAVACVVIGILMLISCAPAPEPLPPPPEETPATEDVVHVIHYSGETLGIIAKWYTGKSENWNLIAGANPGLKPTRLHLGQSITIPGQLVTNREPLPHSVVKKALSQIKPKPADELNAPAANPLLQSAEGDMGVGTTEVPALEKMPGESTAEPYGQKPLEEPPAVDETIRMPAEPAAPAKGEVEKAAPRAPLDETQAVPKTRTAPKPPADQDAERERLLDELLSQ